MVTCRVRGKEKLRANQTRSFFLSIRQEFFKEENMPSQAPVFPIDFSHYKLRSSFGDPSTLSGHVMRRSGDFTWVESTLILDGEWRYAQVNSAEELAAALAAVGLPAMDALTFPSEMVVGASRECLLYLSPIPAMMPLDEWMTVIRLESRARMEAAVFIPFRMVGCALAFLSAHRYPDLYQRALQKSGMTPRMFLRDQAARCVSLLERNHTLDVYPFF